MNFHIILFNLLIIIIIIKSNIIEKNDFKMSVNFIKDFSYNLKIKYLFILYQDNYETGNSYIIINYFVF